MGTAGRFAAAHRGQEPMTVSRRALVRNVLVAGTGLALASRTSWAMVNDPLIRDPWSGVADLVSRIAPPRIPRRDFPITRYGAKPGGDASAAIRKAIEACHREGGGRVVVPAGEFFTGPIHLKSRVELHIDAGATLRFSQDPAHYPIVFTRWEGVELMNYSPLIYAFECEDVAVTGLGTLDGQADETHWWPWK